MNKREKSEISSHEKKTKRIKTHHGRTNVLASIPINVDCFRLEEKESTQDYFDFFAEACHKLRSHFETINSVKKGKENEVSQLPERTHSCMLIMQLKKLNRLDKHQWKRSKDLVNERKQSVDAMNLQYQNLLYEATHLQKEVTKCMEFRSQDEEIELVSVEEFYKDAPLDISKPAITKKDPHELAMARLFWELEQRKRIAVELKEAEKLKLSLDEEIKKLKEIDSSIHPVLEAIVQAAEPFQSKMGMQFQAVELNYKVARFLPRPLYVLYAQSCAYRQHCKGKTMQVSIEGNTESAKDLAEKSDSISEDSGESDQEETSETEIHRRSISVKKQTVPTDIMIKHPMSVLVSIEKDLKIDLQFFYLTHLQIITVKILSVTPEPMSNDLIGDLLRHDTLLNGLFFGDTGKETPNLANVHLLNDKYDLKDSAFSNERTGLPFVWAQKISGLNFLALPPEDSARMMYTEIPMGVKRTMGAIAARLNARHQLFRQISSLDQRISVEPEFAALYPLNIASSLKRWNPVPWKHVLSHPKIAELKKLHIIDEDSLIYNAEIQRGSALLCALVCVPANYPSHTPVFLLQLSWKGNHTTLSSNALRELEEEVNVHFVGGRASLLLCQLHHLSLGLDLFLEAESAGDAFVGPPEFTRDKVVVRHARGPSRSRPYKCTSNQGIFTFR